MVKLYWWLWSVVAAAALGFYLFGSFSPMVAIVFGFIAFGMVFMGMIGVLPTMSAHPPALAKASEAKADIAASPQFALETRQASPVTVGTVRNTHAAVH
jgi:hypothetical protein